MYTLRRYNPKMAGNVYRITRRCGKSNCRCAQSKRHWHPMYVLEYPQRIKGRWGYKREYIPKQKVKALRQRIRRAKAKDRERQQKLKTFLAEAPRLVERLKADPASWEILGEAERLTQDVPMPVTFLETTKILHALTLLFVTLIDDDHN